MTHISLRVLRIDIPHNPVGEVILSTIDMWIPIVSLKKWVIRGMYNIKFQKNRLVHKTRSRSLKIYLHSRAPRNKF